MQEDNGTIENAFARARDRKPAYEAFYPFLERLFLAQERVRDTVDPELHAPDSGRALAQWNEGFPLLKRWEFPVSVRFAEEIRGVLGNCLPPDNPVMRAAYEALAGGLDRHGDSAEAVWRSFLQHDGEPWEKHIDTQGVDTASLLFLARSCIRPSIEWTAKQLIGRFPLPEGWLRGYCPVCGSLPSLLVLKGEGERKGYCSWCATLWGVNRMQCPNCDNRDHESLGYIYAEEDPLYRAQYCRLCKFYFKVIDARDSTVPLYLPLEEWTTLHLDMLAQKGGWTVPPSPSPAVYGSP